MTNFRMRVIMQGSYAEARQLALHVRLSKIEAPSLVERAEKKASSPPTLARTFPGRTNSLGNDRRFRCNLSLSLTLLAQSVFTLRCVSTWCCPSKSSRRRGSCLILVMFLSPLTLRTAYEGSASFVVIATV